MLEIALYRLTSRAINVACNKADRHTVGVRDRASLRAWMIHCDEGVILGSWKTTGAKELFRDLRGHLLRHYFPLLHAAVSGDEILTLERYVVISMPDDERRVRRLSRPSESRFLCRSADVPSHVSMSKF